MKLDYRKICLEQGSPEVTDGEGLNIIPQPEKEPLWKGYLRKFKDPLIIVLLVVFVFSVSVSLYEIFRADRSWVTMMEPSGVFMALMLATGIGFIFEVKADREFDLLNQKKDERMVKVLRWPAGADRSKDRPQMFQVKRCDVVVGDVVRLENGDEVPADGEILSAQSLRVDESAFTGEMFTRKTAEPEQEGGQQTAYPQDFLLRGSIVIEGHCLYRVTAVGTETEEGKGEKSLQEEKQVETPLNKQLGALGLWITHASYIVAALIVVGRLLYYFFFSIIS